MATVAVLYPVYTIQPVVKPVVQPVRQPAVSCKQTTGCQTGRFDNRFDNSLYRVNGTLLFTNISAICSSGFLGFVQAGRGLYICGGRPDVIPVPKTVESKH